MAKKLTYAGFLVLSSAKHGMLDSLPAYDRKEGVKVMVKKGLLTSDEKITPEGEAALRRWTESK